MTTLHFFVGLGVFGLAALLVLLIWAMCEVAARADASQETAHESRKHAEDIKAQVRADMARFEARRRTQAGRR